MNHFSLFLILLLVAILGAHSFATFTSLYYTLWWLDIVLHFAGGFWLGSILFYIIHYTSLARRIFAPRWIFFVGIVACATLIGVWWEFFEFGVDTYITSFFDAGVTGKTLLTDTLLDLFFDMTGAALAATILLWRKKNIG